MGRVTWRNVVLDERTRDMMEELARISGDIYIHPTQGSYSGGVSASAGTHDQGGAVDLMHPSWGVNDYDTVVRLARKIGFAAWHRTPQQSNWPRHVHLIAVQPGGKLDQGVLSYGAHRQVINYYDGKNGLKSGAADDGPRQFVGVTWEKYQEEADMPLSDEDVQRIAKAVRKEVWGTQDAKTGFSARVMLRRIYWAVVGKSEESTP